jgi:2-methylisocitrate lyase-like PEP mutase family enzyme
VRDAETIGRLAAAIRGPLNVLAGPGTPPVAKLASLGVARVSAGSAPMRAALTAARSAAEEMRDRGTFSFTEGILTHAEVNALLADRTPR